MSIRQTIYSESEGSSEVQKNFSTFPVSKDQKVLKVTVKLIQVVRTTVEVFQPQTYYITAKGVSQSLRQPPDGFFKIGRQQVTETGQRPNDLMLPPSDRAISRSHCMINYKAFFDTTPPEYWIWFLMGSHPRLGQRSVLQMLPQDLFRYILSFLKPKRFPLLIDLGSMCGTYIKISNSEPIILVQNMNFLVGSDINIEIDRVLNDPIPQSLNFEATIEDGCTLQDLTNAHEYPYIIVKVSKFFNDNEATMQSSTWKFLAEEKYKIFTIGRSQVCDINLPENTISRTQCRIIYNEGKWMLSDGIENKPTVNGTWLSICKRSNIIRSWSDPYSLKSGSQIKISDTIIQVDWD
ncbi:hypothetical protein SteCoe_15833 [Stentor coeruleus]|uniref:FHA domain-containing protein n=1 Tax=Stentor coeruleus TaxID=5963 RepID=A0A1R2C2R5_9CILI|nr:hypothetical protein SteCoe_15833 [Stentor coeruleus]